MKKRIALGFSVLLMYLSSCPVPTISFSGKVNAPVLAPVEYSAKQIYSDLVKELQAQVDGETVKTVRIIKHQLDENDDVERPLIHISGTLSYEFSAKDMGADTAGTELGTTIGFPRVNDAVVTLWLYTTTPSVGRIEIGSPVREGFSIDGFKQGIVKSGKLIFLKPDIDMSEAIIMLRESNDLPRTLELKQDGGSGWFCSLDGMSLYKETKIELRGTISFPTELLEEETSGPYTDTVLKLPIGLEIEQFSRVVVTTNADGNGKLPLFDFNEQRWIYNAYFRKIGLRFKPSHPVDGLEYHFEMPELGFNETKLTANRGQMVELSATNKSLDVRDGEGNFISPFSNSNSKLEASYNIGSSNGELTFYDITPPAKNAGAAAGQINITATPEIVFDIANAKLNFSGMPPRPDFPIGKIPNDNEGININDFLEPYDKYLKAENVVFNGINAALFVKDISPDGLLTDTKLKLWSSSSGYLNLNRDNGGYTALKPMNSANPGTLPPEIFGTEYTGSLPPGLLPLDVAEIQKIFRARPVALFGYYDAQFPNKPVTIEFAEDTTLRIPYELFVEIPLDFKVFADSPPEAPQPYATIHFDNIAGKDGDIFDRKNDWDPVVDGAGLKTVKVTINFDNSLGYEGLEAWLVSKNGSVENFRQILGALNDGKGSFSVELETDSIPSPFTPGVEVRLPATESEGGKNYAPLKIRRGGGITVELKIGAEGSVEIR
jgi:hypothetical protein